MNEHEQNYWNTEISDSLLDQIAAEGAEWLKFWPDEVELLLALRAGDMHVFLDAVGHKMPADHEMGGVAK